MRQLMAYSALTTKIKAMEGHFLKREDFERMASFETLSEVEEYIDRKTGLHGLSSHPETALFRDFEKLSHFSGKHTQPLFHILFLRFETELLKARLRDIAAHQSPASLSKPCEDFFRRHGSLSLEGLEGAKSLSQLLEVLEKTAYYPILAPLAESKTAGQFDYETALDLFWIQNAWRGFYKFFSPGERALLLQEFGTKLDLLNIQWICRMKRFYHLPAETIGGYLIPIRFRLRKSQLELLAAAETEEAFLLALSQTPYGPELACRDAGELSDLELLSRRLLDHCHRTASRSRPYSAAFLYSHFYFREQEIRNIITVTEGVRCHAGPEKILELICLPYSGGEHCHG